MQWKGKISLCLPPSEDAASLQNKTRLRDTTSPLFIALWIYECTVCALDLFEAFCLHES